MVFALVFGLGFGALDQYLGSLWSLTALGAWAVSVSGMSAPWLALPFAFGATGATPRRAVALGALVTGAALLGYFAMTLSPFEGVNAGHVDLIAFASSQRLNLAGGVITGPLFGLLGHLWRTRRMWLSLLGVAGTFCLEPVARTFTGRLGGQSGVWIVEAVIGIVLCVYAAARQRGATNEV